MFHGAIMTEAKFAKQIEAPHGRKNYPNDDKDFALQEIPVIGKVNI